ncbi:unnamed protein product [Urochloa humidicola]
MTGNGSLRHQRVGDKVASRFWEEPKARAVGKAIQDGPDHAHFDSVMAFLLAGGSPFASASFSKPDRCLLR